MSVVVANKILLLLKWIISLQLLRVIEAKKIFGNPEYRACFKDCFRSNRKLEDSWNTYKNRLNELGTC